MFIFKMKYWNESNIYFLPSYTYNIIVFWYIQEQEKFCWSQKSKSAKALLETSFQTRFASYL